MARALVGAGGAPRLRTRGVEEKREVARAPVLGDFVDLRRHGPEERYRSGCSREMLRSDAQWCLRWLRDGRDVFAFFDNDRGGHAVRDAKSLARSIAAGQRARGTEKGRPAPARVVAGAVALKGPAGR